MVGMIETLYDLLSHPFRRGVPTGYLRPVEVEVHAVVATPLLDDLGGALRLPKRLYLIIAQPFDRLDPIRLLGDNERDERSRAGSQPAVPAPLF